MNNNIILLSYLLIKDKLSKLFLINNYFAKLLIILYFNDDLLLIKSKNFYKEYKLLNNLYIIINKLTFKIKIPQLYLINKINLNFSGLKFIPAHIGLLVY
jgi:hypothetical protein